jgi:hypothetical protein
MQRKLSFLHNLFISRCVILLLIMFISVRLTAQHTDSFKLWSSTTPLSLKDFKHPLDSAALKADYIYKASSLLDIKMKVPEFEKQDSVITYEIHAVFYRYLSWIYDTTRLKHEMLHFDIGEVYARRMRRWLNITKLDPGSYNMVKIKLNELYYDHAKYHALYDKETHTGKLPNMQLLWERNIKKQLDTLQKYDKPQGTVRFMQRNR